MSDGVVFSYPYLLGFDHLERLRSAQLNRLLTVIRPTISSERDQSGFGSSLRGWVHADDLNVTVENNQFVIGGQQTEMPGRAFLHRGIAARPFRRAFVSRTESKYRAHN